MAEPPRGQPVRVSTLGEPPPGWTTYPSPMRWHAILHVPQNWNYHFRIGPGPARLSIDGTEILTLSEGDSAKETVASLARGGHFIEYNGTLSGDDQPATFLWAQEPVQVPDQSTPALGWRRPRTEELNSNATGPRGLYGIVNINDAQQPKPEHHRIDGTLATCCTADQVGFNYPYGGVYNATWTGALDAPTTGTYSMGIFSQGIVELGIDDKQVIYQGDPADQTTTGTVDLTAGPHAVRVEYHVENSPGALEWTWTPPGGVNSIVPPEVLSPPPGAGVSAPESQSVLHNREFYVVEEPLKTVP